MTTARFEGKVAIVTGAASGIGAATRRRFGREGADVVVLDVDEDGARSVAEDIANDGGSSMVQVADVSEEAAVERAVAAVLDSFGRIDVLHNNAAAMELVAGGGDGDIEDLDVALWDRKMAVNVRGVMLGCKHAVPVMRRAGEGVIINTASVSGLVGTDSNAAYGASKAAIVNLTRSIASMVGADGIRCNAIAPGLTMTTRVQASMSEAQLAIYGAERLLPWAATPEDIAATVAWLASDEARAITGQTIVIDSGTTAHRPRHAIAQWLRAGN